MKLFHTPDAEPTVSKATETNELIGGMWLVSRFEGQMMGMPFTGVGHWGYDPAEKKYVGTWIDNMTPYMQNDPRRLRPGHQDDDRRLREPRPDERREDHVQGRRRGRSTTNTRHVRDVDAGWKGGYQKMLEIEYKRRAE